MATTLRDRIGLPDVSGRRGLVGAVVIDSLGSGLFLPFAVVYFLKTTTLSLTTVGLGLSVAALLALPTSPLFGPVVDRIGAKRSVLISNLLQTIGFMGYLWVSSVWYLLICALLVNMGQNIYWTANGAVISVAADPGERPRWFGMARALRNVGYGLGALLASVSVTIGAENGYRALALANAVSFVVAAVLISSWSPAPASVPKTADTESGPRVRGYRTVLTDRPYLLLLCANVLFVLCMLVVTVVLTVYVTGPLGRPGWLAGAMFTVNTLLVALTQTTVAKLTERSTRTTVLRAAAALWTLSFLLMWGASAVTAALVISGVVLAILCHTAAEVLYSPAMGDLVASFAPPELRGRYFAVHQLSWSVPSSLAPACFTWLLAHGTQWLWIALLGVCAALFATLSRLAGTLRHTKERELAGTAAD